MSHNHSWLKQPRCTDSAGPVCLLRQSQTKAVHPIHLPRQQINFFEEFKFVLQNNTNKFYSSQLRITIEIISHIQMHFIRK